MLLRYRRTLFNHFAYPKLPGLIKIVWIENFSGIVCKNQKKHMLQEKSFGLIHYSLFVVSRSMSVYGSMDLILYESADFKHNKFLQ